MASKVIVTGGAGFFGAHITKQLLAEGDEVTIVDLAPPSKFFLALIPPEQVARVTFVKVGVDTEEFVALVVATAPQAVIHLAGLQIPTCRGNPVLGARVNVIGTLNVFEAARQLQAKAPGAPLMRVVYASSAAIFGPDADYGDAPAGDASVPNPSSHYGAYKLCGEHCAKAYWLDYKVRLGRVRWARRLFPAPGFPHLTPYAPPPATLRPPARPPPSPADPLCGPAPADRVRPRARHGPDLLPHARRGCRHHGQGV
jgi:nucleoside-diphosphate-sugar epimerase